MKKVLTTSIFIIVLGFSNLYSQTVDDIPLRDLDIDYIEIVGRGQGAFGLKITIKIDYGQRRTISQKEGTLKDELGKTLVFNSMIDALNFLSQNGFEFVNAYAISNSAESVYHYILKKKNE